MQSVSLNKLMSYFKIKNRITNRLSCIEHRRHRNLRSTVHVNWKLTTCIYINRVRLSKVVIWIVIVENRQKNSREICLKLISEIKMFDEKLLPLTNVTVLTSLYRNHVFNGINIDVAYWIALKFPLSRRQEKNNDKKV